MDKKVEKELANHFAKYENQVYLPDENIVIIQMSINLYVFLGKRGG